MKYALLLLLLSLGLVSVAQDGDSNEPFYYEAISNGDKSINFLIGLYPTSAEFVRRSDGSGYTKIRMAIMNDSRLALEWADYKVYVLLKNGDLFYNYTTSATSGDLMCEYSVGSTETHLQNLCFEKEFNIADIQTVYLSLLDNKFFPLYYSEGTTDSDGGSRR